MGNLDKLCQSKRRTHGKRVNNQYNCKSFDNFSDYQRHLGSTYSTCPFHFIIKFYLDQLEIQGKD